MSSIAAELLMVSGNALDLEAEREIAALEKALAAAKLKKARMGEPGSEQPQQLPISKRPVEPDGWAAIEHGKVAAVVASFQSGTSSSQPRGSSAALHAVRLGDGGGQGSAGGRAPHGSTGARGPLGKVGKTPAPKGGKERRKRQRCVGGGGSGGCEGGGDGGCTAIARVFWNQTRH